MSSKKNSPYKVILAKEASSYIKRLEREVAIRIVKRLDVLAIDPYSGDVKRLKGKNNLWRCRVGKFRIIYTVNEEERVVAVVAVRPRGDVYKK